MSSNKSDAPKPRTKKQPVKPVPLKDLEQPASQSLDVVPAAASPAPQETSSTGEASFVPPATPVPVPSQADITSAQEKTETVEPTPPAAEYSKSQNKNEIRLAPAAVKAKTQPKKSEEKLNIVPSTVDENDDESASIDEEVVLHKATEAVAEAPSEEEEHDADAIFLAPIKPHVKIQTNKYVRTLRNFDPDPNEIQVEEMDGSDQNFRIAYEDTKKNLLASPRLTRVPLVLSGYHAEISAFSHSDVISIARNLNEGNHIRRMELIVNSIFEHVISTSKGDLTFDQWIDSTLWPDLESLFFGIYSATYPGENPYDITCDSCSHEFTVGVNNEDLAYVSSKLIRDDDLRIIMSGSDEAIKKLPIYQKANPVNNVKHKLRSSKIYVEYKIPTIREYLSTLRGIQGTGQFEDPGNVENQRSVEFRFLRIYPYVHRIGLPVIAETATGKEVSYKGTYDRLSISGVLNTLSQEDFESLLDRPEAVELINLRGIQFSIKAMDCPNCKVHIQSIPLNIRNIFFTMVQGIIGTDA